MTEEKQVSIVLGSYNRLPFLKAAVESARSEVEGTAHEIIVVDGGSDDGSLEWLVKQKDVVTIVQHNRGEWLGKPVERRSWGYFMNLGFKAARGRYILMISDDCLLLPGAVKKGIEHFEALLAEGRKVGALAFYWRNWPEKQEYRVGLALGEKMFVNHGLFLREAVAEVGWIDEKTYSFYHADSDLGLKLWQAGYEVLDAPDSYVEHWSHANQKVRGSNAKIQPQDWANYLEKWKGIFYDPQHPGSRDWIYRDFVDSANTAARFAPIQKAFEQNMARRRYKNLAARVFRKMKGLIESPK